MANPLTPQTNAVKARWEEQLKKLQELLDSINEQIKEIEFALKNKSAMNTKAKQAKEQLKKAKADAEAAAKEVESAMNQMKEQISAIQEKLKPIIKLYELVQSPPGMDEIITFVSDVCKSVAEVLAPYMTTQLDSVTALAANVEGQAKAVIKNAEIKMANIQLESKQQQLESANTADSTQK